MGITGYLKMSKGKFKASPIKKYVTAFFSVPVPKVAQQNTYFYELGDLLEVVAQRTLIRN
jgi:hypothetical protein